MVILVFFIILLILLLILEKLIRNWLGVEKKQISETSGKMIERWGSGIIAVTFLCSLTYILSKDSNVTKFFYMIYLTLLYGFQSFIQWIYIKNSKEYLVTLILLIIGLVMLYNIDFIIQRTIAA